MKTYEIFCNRKFVKSYKYYKCAYKYARKLIGNVLIIDSTGQMEFV